MDVVAEGLLENQHMIRLSSFCAHLLVEMSKWRYNAHWIPHFRTLALDTIDLGMGLLNVGEPQLPYRGHIFCALAWLSIATKEMYQVIMSAADQTRWLIWMGCLQWMKRLGWTEDEQRLVDWLINIIESWNMAHQPQGQITQGQVQNQTQGQVQYQTQGQVQYQTQGQVQYQTQGQAPGGGRGGWRGSGRGRGGGRRGTWRGRGGLSPESNRR